MDPIELDYGAISIDNSIFKGEGYKFDEGVLAQLNQFKESPVQIIISDIIHNEAINHISNDIRSARSTINQNLRSAAKQLKIDIESVEQARALLSIEGDEYTIAEGRLSRFYEQIGANVINSADYVDLTQLTKMYFDTQPPFETGKDKKNEFPDALALLGLEGWADESNLNVIVVSNDSGWKNYSKTSSKLTVLSSLAEALEKFQPHNKVKSIIDYIRVGSLLQGDNHILQQIKQAIICSIDESAIDIDADSYLSFEWDDVQASYIKHALDADLNGSVLVRVIRIMDEEIILELGATVDVEVEASFNFSVYDSIDKDDVYIGGCVHKTIEKYHTDILLTLSGDFSQNIDLLEVSDIEVLEAVQHAQFGTIEPNFSDESYDE